MQYLYKDIKVYNELELCEVYDTACKERIEKELLRNRVSYFIKYPAVGLFSKHKNRYIFCVNEGAVTKAEDVIYSVCDEGGFSVKFLKKKLPNTYF